MSAFVLDTSIALKWFLEDENDRAYSLAILGSLSVEYRPIVPWLWYYEIANVLLTQVHRKRIVFEEAEAFLSLMRAPNGYTGPLRSFPNFKRFHTFSASATTDAAGQKKVNPDVWVLCLGRVGTSGVTSDQPSALGR